MTTIIQPNQESKKTQVFLTTIFLNIVFISSAVVMILLYSQVANFRQEIKKQSAGLRTIETQNAELKNSLYTAIDSINPQNLNAAGSSLILESNPEYIKKEQLAGF